MYKNIIRRTLFLAVLVITIVVGSFILYKDLGSNTKADSNFIFNATEIQHSWYNSDNGYLYVSTTNGGLYVIDTKTTITTNDDSLIFNYNIDSSPSINSDSAMSSWMDKTTGFLYVASGWRSTGGASIIDTKKTNTPSDDVLVKNYVPTSTPAIGDGRVTNIYQDINNNLLYISTYGGGLSVINQNDSTSYTYKTTGVYDTTVGSIGTLISANPTVPSDQVSGMFILPSTNDLYITTFNGMVVIDTADTISPADDTVVRSYNTSSTPALCLNWIQREPYFDEVNNLIYVGTQSGSPGCLSVINLNDNTSFSYRNTGVWNTTNSSTGTLISSNPKLIANPVRHTFIDSTNDLIYTSHYNSSEAVSVISRNGTIDPSDDTVVGYYGLSTNPSVNDDWANHVWVDTNLGALFVSTQYGGISILDTKKTITISDDELGGTYSYIYTYPSNTINSIIKMYGFGDSSNNFGGDQSSSDAIGDLNGDGYDDLVIGQHRSRSNQGKVLLFKGSSSGLTSAVSNYILGEKAPDYFGYTNSIADLNRDGYDDLITTAVYSPSGSTGRVYIFWGKSDFFESITSYNQADLIINAEQVGSRFGGTDKIGVGDFNNDGWEDLAIGAYGYDADGLTDRGRTYIFWGGSTAWDNDLNAGTDSDITITGDTAYSMTGQGNYVGDANNDGIDDLIISSWRNDLSYVGQLSIFFGSSSFSTNKLVSEADLTIKGTYTSSYMGGRQNVFFADINADNKNELIVGETSSARGRVYIFKGENNFSSKGSLFVTQADIIIEEGTLGSSFSRGLVVEDFDNDGMKDIAIGVPFLGLKSAITNGDVVGGTKIFFAKELYSITGKVSGESLHYLFISPTGYRSRNEYNGYHVFANDFNKNGYIEFGTIGILGGTGRVELHELGTSKVNISVSPISIINNPVPAIPGVSSTATENIFIPKTRNLLNLGSYDAVNGTFSDWDSQHTGYTPSVINVSGTYHVWFSGYAYNESIWRIGYASSPDGINWTKYDGNNCGKTGDGCIFDRGIASAWDDAHLYGISVLYDTDESIYKMWYGGHDGSYHRIGYATSSDGITWTRYDNPAVASCGFAEAYDDGCVFNRGIANAWDDAHITYHKVSKEDGIYKMWYSGNDGAKWRIGYATSTDGITWTRYDDPLVAACGFTETYDDGCVLSVGEVGEFDNNGVIQSGVVKEGSDYKLWYSGNNIDKWEIGLATSPDGINWTKHTANPVLKLSSTHSSDKAHVYLATALKENDLYKLWYVAHDGVNVRLANATSTDGIVWNKLTEDENHSFVDTVGGIQARIDNGVWFECLASDGVFNSQNESYNCVSPATLLEGVHTIETREYNASGIFILPEKYAKAQFVVDITPPSFRITNINTASNVPDLLKLYYYLYYNTPKIEGTCEPGASVVFEYNTKVVETECNSDGKFSIILNNPALNIGKNSLNYYSVDVAGNKSIEKSLTLTVGEEYFPDWITVKLPEEQEDTAGEGEDILDIDDNYEDNDDDFNGNRSIDLYFTDQNNNPLINATITIDGKKYITDNDGKISINGEYSGEIKILVEYQGKKYEMGLILGADDVRKDIKVEIKVKSKPYWLIPILLIILLIIIVWTYRKYRDKQKESQVS